MRGRILGITQAAAMASSEIRDKKTLTFRRKVFGKMSSPRLSQNVKKNCRKLFPRVSFLWGITVFINDAEYDAFSATKIKLPGKVGRVGTIKSMNE